MVLWTMEMECSSSVLTFEEGVLQAAVLHVLVDEQPVLVLAAVAHQLHQVGVPQLPQEDHLRLRPQQKNTPKSRKNPPATPTFLSFSPDRGRARRDGPPNLSVPAAGARNRRDRSTTKATAASALGVSFAAHVRVSLPTEISQRPIETPIVP